MLVNHVTSNVVDSWGRVLRRTTLYGKYKGDSIVVDAYKYKGGKTLFKRFVIWGDSFQKIVNKERTREGKFERIG